MSAVLDYFSKGISDTYNQTVDYWSKDGSAVDALSVVGWSVTNPKTVVKSAVNGTTKQFSDLGTAVSKDTSFLTSFLVKVVAIVVVLFFVFQYVNAKVKKMGGA